MMEVKRLAKSHSVESWQSADMVLMARKCPHGSLDALSLAGIPDRDVCWPLSVPVTEQSICRRKASDSPRVQRYQPMLEAPLPWACGEAEIGAEKPG